MDFKIVWTEPALDDLRDICLYIAAKDLDSSERIGEDILNHVGLLENFHLLGQHILVVHPVEFARLFAEIIEYSTE